MLIEEYEDRDFAISIAFVNAQEASATKLYFTFIKRCFDFLFAIILFIPCTVIVLFFGILIKFESSGGVFYTQIRVGKNGKDFKIYKLRSMYSNSDCLGPLFTIETDCRITKVGKIIRRYRIDELPQIINVILGQMSFIGPRPLTIYEYETATEDFSKRLYVLPGITGLAQVRGGNNLTNDQKLHFDLSYIRNMSLKLDIKIAFQTIIVIKTGLGAR